MLQLNQPFGRTKKRILDIRPLTNQMILVKTENGKSPNDFRVRTVTFYNQQTRQMRYYTPKHAHFAIDLYGKWCANPSLAWQVFRAIVAVWQGQPPSQVLSSYAASLQGLPGYDLEYILNALDWILEQEDVNFTSRPLELQRQLDAELEQAGVQAPPNREGSQLAVVLLLRVAKGMHPVEAMLAANLDVLPIKRGRGAI
jgi:hypothetical protein